LPNHIDMGNGWIWLGAAYAGYALGTRLSTHYGDVIWKKLAAVLAQYSIKIRSGSEEDPKA